MQNDFTIKIVFTRGPKQKHVEQDVGFLTLKRGLHSYKMCLQTQLQDWHALIP